MSHEDVPTAPLRPGPRLPFESIHVQCIHNPVFRMGVFAFWFQRVVNLLHRTHVAHLRSQSVVFQHCAASAKTQVACDELASGHRHTRRRMPLAIWDHSDAKHAIVLN